VRRWREAHRPTCGSPTTSITRRRTSSARS
jgi:hypothetical protein